MKIILITICSMLTLMSFEAGSAQPKDSYMRIAKLVIDSAQLEPYKAALKEHLETAVRVEPGVLSLNAVYEKNNPTHITVFEIYADEEAYKSHVQTPHFKKYKATTQNMVKSLELIDVVPIDSKAKPSL